MSWDISRYVEAFGNSGRRIFSAGPMWDCCPYKKKDVPEKCIAVLSIFGSIVCGMSAGGEGDIKGLYIRRDLKGSMTVEMSFLMPVILLLIMSGVLGAFYFHDKNILAGAAYETAIVGSTKIREKDHITVGELESLYQERTGRKCILFAGSSARITIEKTQICVAVSARKGHFGLSVIKKAAVTEPENYIRNIRKVKEIADGAKNHD